MLCASISLPSLFVETSATILGRPSTGWWWTFSERLLAE